MMTSQNVLTSHKCPHFAPEMCIMVLCARIHRGTHTYTQIALFSHLGTFEHKPVRCKGEWAAGDSRSMLASVSSHFSHLPRPASLLLHFMLFLSYPFCSPSVSLTHSLYLTCSSVPLSPLIQCTHTRAHTHTLSTSLKSLAFFLSSSLLLDSKKQFLSFVRRVGGKPLSRDFLGWLECH